MHGRADFNSFSFIFGFACDAFWLLSLLFHLVKCYQRCDICFGLSQRRIQWHEQWPVIHYAQVINDKKKTDKNSINAEKKENLNGWNEWMGHTGKVDKYHQDDFIRISRKNLSRSRTVSLSLSIRSWFQTEKQTARIWRTAIKRAAHRHAVKESSQIKRTKKTVERYSSGHCRSGDCYSFAIDWGRTIFRDSNALSTDGNMEHMRLLPWKSDLVAQMYLATFKTTEMHTQIQNDWSAIEDLVGFSSGPLVAFGCATRRDIQFECKRKKCECCCASYPGP